MTLLNDNPEFYWVWLSRAERWEPAEKVKDGWVLTGVDAVYYPNEIRCVGPKLQPPSDAFFSEADHG